MTDPVSGVNNRTFNDYNCLGVVSVESDKVCIWENEKIKNCHSSANPNEAYGWLLGQVNCPAVHLEGKDDKDVPKLKELGENFFNNIE